MRASVHGYVVGNRDHMSRIFLLPQEVGVLGCSRYLWRFAFCRNYAGRVFVVLDEK